MNKVKDTASLAESTVQAVARGEVPAVVRRKRTRGPRKNSPVVVIKVDPRVWETALQLAGGDATRLEVRGETEVVVHNHPRR